MTTPQDDDYRTRLYGAYVTTHAGISTDGALAQIYARDIRPHLPSNLEAQIVDVGCGQGGLVQRLQSDGYVNSTGIDISHEQVAAANNAGVQGIEEGDFLELLAQRPNTYSAVVALDLLEHLTKREVVDTFDAVEEALVPGGVFLARVPNADSPFGGHYRYGDFTHENSFNQRSLHQLSRAAGFDHFTVQPCPPIVHGFKSMMRAATWKGLSAAYKISLAAETGRTSGHIVTLNCLMIARAGS